MQINDLMKIRKITNMQLNEISKTNQDMKVEFNKGIESVTKIKTRNGKFEISSKSFRGKIYQYTKRHGKES